LVGGKKARGEMKTKRTEPATIRGRNEKEENTGCGGSKERTHGAGILARKKNPLRTKRTNPKKGGGKAQKHDSRYGRGKGGFGSNDKKGWGGGKIREREGLGGFSRGVELDNGKQPAIGWGKDMPDKVQKIGNTKKGSL